MSECDGKYCTHPECKNAIRPEDIYKYDGYSRPMTAKESGLNRAQRRELKRKK